MPQHICVSKRTIIGSDDGSSPGRRQAIIWAKAGILLTGPSGTIFSENLNRNSYIFIHKNAFENVVWKKVAMLSRPQCVKSNSIYLLMVGKPALVRVSSAFAINRIKATSHV